MVLEPGCIYLIRHADSAFADLIAVGHTEGPRITTETHTYKNLRPCRLPLPTKTFLPVKID